ncbi:hypothetical protein [Geothrix sp.]|jgi:hypothetical protein|uniref:hypothetical protein n=1 Tax=Geothrix sp. TaxID=1962974 RepID=UPI0025BE7E1E|nr:hypothetical protein [Geothrix sp.]
MASDYQQNIQTSQFLELAETKFAGESKVSLYVQGWEDGDHYLELCNENGGVVPSRHELFKTLPFHYSGPNWSETLCRLNQFLSHPHLGTESGAYKFPYDIFLSTPGMAIVYNPLLLALRQYKPTIHERLFGLALPAWQNESQPSF